MEFKTWNDRKKEILKNSDVKKEYDALQEEFKIVDEILSAREKANMTQIELAEKSGVPQADISRIEGGKANPTINTLKKIAKAFGKKLEIRFV